MTDGAWKQYNGVPIEESVRDKWAHDAIKFLIENPEEYFVYYLSGDSAVFAHKAVEVDNSTTIEVYDVKIRRNISIYQV